MFLPTSLLPFLQQRSALTRLMHSLSLQRWHGQLSAVIAALQAAAGVQAPSGTAVTEARQQGSDRESVASGASGATRSSYADGRDMLGGTHASGAVVLDQSCKQLQHEVWGCAVVQGM
jgi:hypothetical protein